VSTGFSQSSGAATDNDNIWVSIVYVSSYDNNIETSSFSIG
jgi:hypothetical protein